MNILHWKEKTWQKIFEVQLLFASLMFLLAIISNPNSQALGELIIILLLLALNIFQDRNSKLKLIVTWLNIILIPTCFTTVWQVSTNLLIKAVPALEICWIFIMWIFYIFLLVPLVMVSAKYVNNWFLRLVAFFFLNVQFSNSMIINIKHLPIMHSFNDQGVIAAIATLVTICFLVYSWGYQFNPDLKFIKSKNFNWITATALIVLSAISVWWNAFGGNGNTIWSILFSTEISKFNFTWPNFTSALEPGILEEMVRYIWIIILLAGFKNFTKWRVPIAIYGSTLFFALMHLSNIGVHGQSFAGTISQVVAVTDAIIWAVTYLYFGKIWLTMIPHFLLDYFINLQTGWTSTSTFSGSFADWMTTIIPLIFGLAVSIWMLFGKRRQVMEENVDRLLRTNSMVKNN